MMFKVLSKQVFNKDNMKFLGILAWMLSSACILYFFDANITVPVAFKILAVSLFFSFSIFLVFIFSGKRGKLFLLLVSALVIIPTLIVISAYSVTGSVLHRSDFRVIFTTDPSESAEFISQFVSCKVIFLLAAYIMPLLFIFKVKISKPDAGRISRILVLILVLTSVFFVSKENWRFVSKRYHVIDFYRSFYDFKKEQKFDQWVALRQKIKSDDRAVSELKIKKPKTFVIIIGESLSRNHMQLYGYKRETNPELSSMKKELYVFRDVVSPATTTIDTMKYVLTLADQQHPEYFFEKRSIVNLFAEAGYETVWIGNQNFRGNRYNICHGVIAKECTRAYEIAQEKDQVVVDTLDGLLRGGTDTNRVVFIHLRGSHTKYSTRYTGDFNYFDHRKIPIPYVRDLSYEEKKIIDEYDNSVRYNDYIISSIIELVKSRCEFSWVLYFSDHGEELFEYRGMYGHQAKNISRFMCEIPFILWVSEKYRGANRDIFSKMPGYLDRPYSTENVIHSISDLSKLKFDDLDTSKSLLSGNFKDRLRTVNGLPYAAIPPAENQSYVFK